MDTVCRLGDTQVGREAAAAAPVAPPDQEGEVKEQEAVQRPAVGSDMPPSADTVTDADDLPPGRGSPPEQ